MDVGQLGRSDGGRCLPERLLRTGILSDQVVAHDVRNLQFVGHRLVRSLLEVRHRLLFLAGWIADVGHRWCCPTAEVFVFACILIDQLKVEEQVVDGSFRDGRLDCGLLRVTGYVQASVLRNGAVGIFLNVRILSRPRQQLALPSAVFVVTREMAAEVASQERVGEVLVVVVVFAPAYCSTTSLHFVLPLELAQFALHRRAAVRIYRNDLQTELESVIVVESDC